MSYHISLLRSLYSIQNNVWNMFRVNDKDTIRPMSTASFWCLFLELWRYFTQFWCLHCWLWTSKLRLRIKSLVGLPFQGQYCKNTSIASPVQPDGFLQIYYIIQNSEWIYMGNVVLNKVFHCQKDNQTKIAISFILCLINITN